MSEAFKSLVAQYDQRFTHGCFSFASGDNLKAVIRGAGVPNEPGVYVLYPPEGCRPLYIGRAGKLTLNGLSSQGLRKRLANKQGGLPRQQYFENKLRIEGLPSIVIKWWRTVQPDLLLLPSKAEGDLFQAFYEEFGTVADWNQEF